LNLPLQSAKHKDQIGSTFGGQLAIGNVMACRFKKDVGRFRLSEFDESKGNKNFPSISC
jgi:hypothetical protein